MGQRQAPTSDLGSSDAQLCKHLLSVYHGNAEQHSQREHSKPIAHAYMRASILGARDANVYDLLALIDTWSPKRFRTQKVQQHAKRLEVAGNTAIYLRRLTQVYTDSFINKLTDELSTRHVQHQCDQI